MQQKLLLLSGNGYKYKSRTNNAGKLIYKHYPKTPLLTNDEYYPRVEPKAKQIELKPNMFYVLLKAFLNSFIGKTPPMIKEDPYECGLDSAYSIQNVKEQKEVTDNDLSMNLSGFSGSNLYDLYLDAYKKNKMGRENIIPNFTVQENPISSYDALFSFVSTDIVITNKKYSKQLNLCAVIDELVNGHCRYIPEQLKQKIKNLSPQDKAKFIHFFDRCMILHEMQHFKQFATMLKVYGVEGYKNIVIERIQKQKTELIDNVYKEIVQRDVPLILNNEEKVEEIKKHVFDNFNLKMKSVQEALEDDGDKENSGLFKIIVAQCNKIENSENQQEIQDGIKIIILPNLEKIYNSIAPNNSIGASILSALKIIFETIMTKHTTFQGYFENIWQEVLQKFQKEENDINTEQYQKIYDSLKEQPITEEERKNAEIYKNAFLSYIALDVDADAYYSNPLEIEAYTVQAQAALEKLQEYNERHKGKDNKY